MSHGQVLDPKLLEKEVENVPFERFSAAIFSSYRQLILVVTTCYCRHCFVYM